MNSIDCFIFVVIFILSVIETSKSEIYVIINLKHIYLSVLLTHIQAFTFGNMTAGDQ